MGPWSRGLGWAAAALLIVGCGHPEGSTGATGPLPAHDAGSTSAEPPRGDAGSVDAHREPTADAGRADAGHGQVAATDAGHADAGQGLPPAHDAGRATDAGRAMDAGRGMDASQAMDAGGATDAGPAAPPALCRMAITCDKTIPNDPKITCTFTLADGAGVTEFDDHIGIELHGRSSLTFPKKNYSIELHDAAGDDEATDLLGMGKESDWILDGMWADRSLMRNALIFDAFRDLGGLHYAPKGRWCTLDLNGQPQGLYRVEEKIKRDDDRVVLTADDGTGKSFIIKQDSGGTATLSIGEESHWELVYPNQDKATSAQLAGVQTWLNALGKALNSPTDPQIGLLTLLDRDAAVDWLLFEEMMKNIDAYNLSIHFSRDAGGLARLIPWDFDLSLGQPTVSGDNSMPANDQPGGWIIHHTSLSKGLAAVPDIVQRLGPRWREVRAGPLSDAALQARLDAYQVTLAADAVAQNFKIWPLAQINYTQTYAPYSLYPVTSYADEVSKLRAFLTARLAWMDAHVDGYPN